MQCRECRRATLLHTAVVLPDAGLRNGPLSMGDNPEFKIQSEDFPALPGFKGAYHKSLLSRQRALHLRGTLRGATLQGYTEGMH